MNCMIVLVSTEGERGEREQEREREDPEISSSSAGYTATSGLGTEGIIVQESMKINIHSSLTSDIYFCASSNITG